MKKFLVLVAIAASSIFTSPPAAAAGEVLTGDTRLACEAILCLASSVRPNECQPSLNRFFGISLRRLSDTLKARENFLRMCPAASDPYSEQVIAKALGQDICSPDKLNQNYLTTPMESGYYIPDPQLPAQCVTYYNNPAVAATMKAPVFVGLPGCGGAWQNGNELAMRTKEWESKVNQWRMQGGGTDDQCSAQISAYPLGNPQRVQQGFEQYRMAPLGAPSGWEFQR